MMSSGTHEPLVETRGVGSPDPSFLGFLEEAAMVGGVVDLSVRSTGDRASDLSSRDPMVRESAWSWFYPKARAIAASKLRNHYGLRAGFDDQDVDDTIDASMVIRNDNLSVYHGNDNYVSAETLMGLKRAVGSVDVGCVPFAYIHWYPFLLDGVPQAWRAGEARLRKTGRGRGRVREARDLAGACFPLESLRPLRRA